MKITRAQYEADPGGWLRRSASEEIEVVDADGRRLFGFGGPVADEGSNDQKCPGYGEDMHDEMHCYECRQRPTTATEEQLRAAAEEGLRLRREVEARIRKMRAHTSHHDDCGCLRARLEAERDEAREESKRTLSALKTAYEGDWEAVLEIMRERDEALSWLRALAARLEAVELLNARLFAGIRHQSESLRTVRAEREAYWLALVQAGIRPEPPMGGEYLAGLRGLAEREAGE